MDWPAAAPVAFPATSLTTRSRNSPVGQALRLATVTFGSAVYPVANLGVFVPVVIPAAQTIYQLAWYNGSVVSGNVDCGIYDQQGNRLISTGSTAQVTANVLQPVDIADTLLAAGVYYLALACDNVTATFQRSSVTSQTVMAGGGGQMASAFPLPSTFTLAPFAQTVMPLIAALPRSVF